MFEKFTSIFFYLIYKNKIKKQIRIRATKCNMSSLTKFIFVFLLRSSDVMSDSELFVVACGALKLGVQKSRPKDSAHL